MFKFVDIETTSFCNAKCPFCNRTNMEFTPKHLKLDIIKKLPFEKIEHVLLLGNKGDAIFYPKLFELIEYICEFDGSWITIHTNASAHKEKWWVKLADLLKENGDIVYALDGMEDTHKLHRVGTDFKKIIRNMKAFNSAGGRSVCQFLKFKHNQDQVEDVKKLVKSIGTEDFWVRKSRGFKEELGLERPDGAKTRFELGRENRDKKIWCTHVKTGSFVLTVDGEIRPCCFMADDDYDKDFKMHFFQNRKHVQHLIAYKADPKSISLKHHTFDEIMNSRYYKWIRKNYPFLYRCHEKCHVGWDDIVDKECL